MAPDRQTYDPADSRLRTAFEMLNDGLNATDTTIQKRILTRIIDNYKDYDAPWVPDIVGRAYGARAKLHNRSGDLEEALDDYNKAVETSPWSSDFVIARGSVLEGLGRFEDAVADYRAVCDAQPFDSAAWNMLGNATLELGNVDEANRYYKRAAELAPDPFNFAQCGQAGFEC